MIIKNKLFDAYRRIFDSINTGVAQQDVCPAIRFLQDDQNNTILLTLINVRAYEKTIFIIGSTFIGMRHTERPRG